MNFRNIKTVAFPREHGAYGFTIEPLLLGLLAGYTTSGLFLAIGTLLIFFAHQPVKILFGANKETRKPAVLFLIAYGVIAVILFYFFLKQVSFFIAAPFYVALTLMIFYLIMDLLNFSRHIVIEIIAPAAISLIAVSIVLNAGWTFINAFGLWALLAARFFPTPLYIRSRLRLEKNLKANKTGAIFSSVFSLFFIVILTMLDITPWLALLSVFILELRIWSGLSPIRKKSTVKAIGMREFFYGQVLVLLSALGYYFSI